MSNKKNGAVGFRLAFNYLKANRFVDAIDVSKDILKSYPDYPKVNSDIITKARAMIKAWRILPQFLIYWERVVYSAAVASLFI